MRVEACLVSALSVSWWLIKLERREGAIPLLVWRRADRPSSCEQRGAAGALAVRLVTVRRSTSTGAGGAGLG